MAHLNQTRTDATAAPPAMQQSSCGRMDLCAEPAQTCFASKRTLDTTDVQARTAAPLASWNDGPAKQAILEFVRAGRKRQASA